MRRTHRRRAPQHAEALREEQTLTQEKLAYESGLASKGHLSGIENGLVRPTLQTLRMLADRLEVDMLDLFTFPEESPRHRLINRLTDGSGASYRDLLVAAEATESLRVVDGELDNTWTPSNKITVSPR